jgi:hypothetical protein
MGQCYGLLRYWVDASSVILRVLTAKTIPKQYRSNIEAVSKKILGCCFVVGLVFKRKGTEAQSTTDQCLFSLRLSASALKLHNLARIDIPFVLP